MVPSLSIFLILFSTFSSLDSAWPVPYKRYPYRPVNDPFCQAMYTFCPTGMNKMPVFDKDDIIDVFALKAPVWEFKYGNLLGYLNIMHDAIGFRSHKTNINYTIEWYELDQLLNCTFPNLINSTEMMWCNQGASCIMQGIDDTHWRDNGTLIKVAEMTGIQFQNYSDYVLWDNRTGIYYETWMVMEKLDGITWFEAHDCATFVLNSFQKMAELGVTFNRSISLKYTMIIIFSDTPTYLGNITEIKQKPQIYKDILKFYDIFQAPGGFLHIAENVLKFAFEVFIRKRFILFYNYEYWNLPLKHPFFKLLYKEIPLP